MKSRIILKCRYRDYDLARVWALAEHLVIQRGEWAAERPDSPDEFIVFETERLPYAENEELKGIYDRELGAWDLDALYALVHQWCESETA